MHTLLLIKNIVDLSPPETVRTAEDNEARNKYKLAMLFFPAKAKKIT